jgi:hypothetical protein
MIVHQLNYLFEEFDIKLEASLGNQKIVIKRKLMQALYLPKLLSHSRQQHTGVYFQNLKHI